MKRGYLWAETEKADVMCCKDDILHLVIFGEVVLNKYLQAQKDALIPLTMSRGFLFLTKFRFILLILGSAKLPYCQYRNSVTLLLQVSDLPCNIFG